MLNKFLEATSSHYLEQHLYVVLSYVGKDRKELNLKHMEIKYTARCVHF